MPKSDEIRKRSRKAVPAEVPVAKKIRIEEPLPAVVPPESAVDITEAFIVERLTPDLAAQLVVAGMVCALYFE